MKLWLCSLVFIFGGLLAVTPPGYAQSQTPEEKAAEEKKAADEKKAAEEKKERLEKITKDVNGSIDDAGESAKKAQAAADESKVKADSAWMLVSTAFVMLMVPGLALFYGGMVRRKNILATMMHSMVCLSVIGVYWIGIGYALAFGDPWITFGDKGSILGFSKKLVFLQGVKPTELLPGTNIPIYLHLLYQGMFAIITPALISGAIAERIRFFPYLVFTLIWETIVYVPLAHMVWAMDWWTGAENAGLAAVGYLGKMGALDFAGGTVVHIAAGLTSLAAIIVLRKRLGYPEQAIHPSSMVLTLTGAGLLWFGWFGFNGGSGLLSGTLAVSAFAATQAAAAAAGLTWMLVEWIHRGKPTALGLASGIVAGLVAVTPASGYVFPLGGLIIGALAGVVCYASVFAKSIFKYDDSLDAFGVHGVGGFFGAVLTGVFCSSEINSVVPTDISKQVGIQFYAAALAAVLAFVVGAILVKLVDIVLGFTTDADSETTGLDQTEHGEAGFDFGLNMEQAAMTTEPRAAVVPPNGKRFALVVEGIDTNELAKSWSDLCQPSKSTPSEFKAIYPFVTTIRGNRFQLRGGDQDSLKDHLQKLLQGRLKGSVKVKVEN